MFAIAFDLNTEVLRSLYPTPSFTNAYRDIRKKLAAHGFSKRQRTLYVGHSSSSECTCIAALLDLNQSFSWFRPSLRDDCFLVLQDRLPTLPPSNDNDGGQDR